MEKSVAEVLDGYSIAYLKAERIPSKETEKNFEEYQKALEEIKNDYQHIDWSMIVETFIGVNSSIWELESEIRKGAIDNDLEEVGRRAILIRKFNQCRVNFGNIVSLFLKEGMLNLKKEHVSA